MNQSMVDWLPKACSTIRRGIALIVAMLIMVLLSALGLSLTMVTATEERVAHSYLSGSESFYAADAALELAVKELALQPDWSRVLEGRRRRHLLTRPRRLALARRAGEDESEATAFVTCARMTCSRQTWTHGRRIGPGARTTLDGGCLPSARCRP